MGKHHFKTAMIIIISSIILCSMISAHLSNAVITESIETKSPYEQYVSASHNVSRRDAVLDYIQALYSQEGIFYGWLEATPIDPRIGSYRYIANVYDPYTILKQLGSTDVIDWSNCTNFLMSLVNIAPSSIYYDLVNSSQLSPPTPVSCDFAIQLFPDLGLSGLIHDDAIATYIASCQTSNGGFRFYASYNDSAEMMVVTWSALRALGSIGRLSVIDTSAALSYVLSCYHTDGGFSNTPDAEAEPNVVPLGLFCLNILGHPDLIRTQNTTDYLLQYFGGASTTFVDSLVNTEGIVWSLYTLGTLDQINVTQMLSWVISCQTAYNGAFLPAPDTDLESERLFFTEAAVHILYLCDRIDLLNETITVEEYPVYHIPQWYIDYINGHFETTTDIGALAPYVGIISLVGLSGVYIVWSNKKNKFERMNNATDANK
jgi:prenyltransferase beta subunit